MEKQALNWRLTPNSGHCLHMQSIISTVHELWHLCEAWEIIYGLSVCPNIHACIQDLFIYLKFAFLNCFQNRKLSTFLKSAFKYVF